MLLSVRFQAHASTARGRLAKLSCAFAPKFYPPLGACLMPLPPPPTESSDYVTTDTLHWIVGIFGAIAAAAWAILLKLIWGRATVQQVEAHAEDDDHRFTAVESKIDDLRDDLKTSEQVVRDGFRDIRADIRSALNSAKQSN